MAQRRQNGAGKPHVKGLVKSPWTIADLNRLLGSARTMPGDVGGIPGRNWWPALLLALLDTGCYPTDLIGAPRAAFDRRNGRLTVAHLIYRLHPLTLEALDAIRRHDAERLLPWPKHPSMLFRDFRTVLYRAGLPHTRANLYDRLRVTAGCVPDVLDAVSMNIAFRPREGKPRFSRAKRRLQRRPKTKLSRADAVYVIASNSPRTLRRIFDEHYRPVVLVDKSSQHAGDMLLAIRRLSDFCGCEVTADMLNDDLVVRFLAWLRGSGRAPDTVNKYRRMLLALWRFAYRKQLADELPRDVPKFRSPKRIPEAWSLDELQRILASAAELEGTLFGVPWVVFLPALILTIYDTGLRIKALLRLRTSDLDLETGWLTVPYEVQKDQESQAFRLSAESLELIRQTEPWTRELLFPYQNLKWGLPALRKRYAAVLQRAGLAHGRRDKFHKLRRTSATYLADAAGDEAAQRHLGHSTIQLTRKHYIDPRKIKRQIVAADVMERPEWKPAG